MDPLRITRASAVDTSAVCTLLQGQFSEHRIALAPDTLRAAVEGLVKVPLRGVVLLAREGNADVGIGVLATTWTLEHGGLVAWLDELYVVPARRGYGIGSALLERAREVAREQGCIALELEVDAAHSRAARLYERTGFRRLERSRWSLRLAPPVPRLPT